MTRSQKRKRDQEEALVVRLGDCSKFLRRKPRPRAGVPTLRMARSMTPPLARSCFFVRGQRPFRQDDEISRSTSAGEESLGPPPEVLGGGIRSTSSKGASGKVHQSPPHRLDDKVRSRVSCPSPNLSLRLVLLADPFAHLSRRARRDGHLQYELGENITPVYKILAPLERVPSDECSSVGIESCVATAPLRSSATCVKYRDATMLGD